MFSRRPVMFVVVLLLILAQFACNLPFSGQQSTPTTTPTDQDRPISQEETALTPDPQSQRTSTFTPVAATATQTLTPTQAPTQTPSATITNTPIPCNAVQFITDVNYPDNSIFTSGAGFVKTWRLKNIGSCTWNSGYQLVFAGGDGMGAPAGIQLTPGTVAPNATVDVSVSLVAPTSAGTYTAYFKLKAPDGAVFGIGPQANAAFWVKIVVQEPTKTNTPPPPVAKADLYISDISFVPYPPDHENPATVKVTVYNGGEAAAGPFRVVWKAGKNYPESEICSWELDSMAAHGGRVLECSYSGYASGYAAIVTLATADVDGEVSESNEGNNTTEKTISVD